MRSILLFICVLCISLHILAQDFIELKSNEILFRTVRNDSKKNEVIRKSDSSLLKSGFYKATSDNRFILFQVNSSGCLTGSFKSYDNQTLFNETLWQDGIQTREFVYLSGRAAIESFDSTVTLMLYDSNKHECLPVKKKIIVEKEFPQKKQEMRIRFTRGGYNSYTLYYYEFGKLVREIIPHYFEKKYDTSGNIILLVEYDWKSKQIITSNFTGRSIVSKNILRNKNIVWESKGMLKYPDNENLGNENLNITYYYSGKVKKKEITKNGKRIVIDYDLSGKIKNQTTYKITEEGEGSNPIPPVEINQ
jgi:hypothetical protein